MNKIKALSVFTLAMLITGSIDSIRNLPASALFGSQLIFFFIFGAIVFLIPVALVSAELVSSHSQKGGVYQWVKMALGDKMALLTIWLQWINTLVWYPTILSFIASTAVYFISPQLAENKVYLVSVILGTFWLMTWVNLKGLQTSAKFASLCTIAGMIIPMALIIFLAGVWVLFGRPVQIHLSFHNLLPQFNHSENWISLTAIIAAYLGMELACVHVKEVHQPQKNFPKALIISVSIILVTMILGSLSIAAVIPHSQINLVAGVIETFNTFFNAYHMHALVIVTTALLLIGSLGGLVNWIISPPKGLLQAAEQNFLPSFLQKQNQHGVASNLLITQAVIVSIVCLAFLLMPSVNGSYWLLTDLSTQLYVLMYMIMFAAALVIKHKFKPSTEKSFQIPGGKIGMWITCILGFIGCTVSFVVGFFPPTDINVGTALHYELIFSLGIIAMIVPATFFFLYQKAKTKKATISIKNYESTQV